jgi:hypothetical protein
MRFRKEGPDGILGDLWMCRQKSHVTQPCQKLHSFALLSSPGLVEKHQCDMLRLHPRKGWGSGRTRLGMCLLFCETVVCIKASLQQAVGANYMVSRRMMQVLVIAEGIILGLRWLWHIWCH